MKNIVSLIAIVLLISCSKNEEEIANPLQEKLVGSWRFVGFLHYDIDMPGGEYFEPLPNENYIMNYYTNNNFEIFSNDTLGQYGTFYVTQNDSIIHRTLTSEFGTINGIDKISKLTPTILEIAPATDDVGIDNHLSISRYEKVITP